MHEPIVYFIEAGRFVKIGWTRNLRQRQNDLRVGCPYDQRFVGFIYGSAEMEAQFHGVVSDCRYRAEWFWNKGRLREWLRGKASLEWVVWDDGFRDLNWCGERPISSEFEAYLHSVGRSPSHYELEPGPTLLPPKALSIDGAAPGSVERMR